MASELGITLPPQEKKNTVTNAHQPLNEKCTLEQNLQTPRAKCSLGSNANLAGQLTSPHLDSGTYILEHAEHFWPPYPYADLMVQFTAVS